MPYVMVDIESDGPIPGKFSMIAIGSVVVEEGLSRRFSAKLRPISDDYIPDALAVSGYTREDRLVAPFEDPTGAMTRGTSTLAFQSTRTRRSNRWTEVEQR